MIEDVQRFNNWFSVNYCVLQKYCKKYRIDEDTLQDVYVNIYDRILRSGYTESYFMTYVKRSIRNLRINEAKKLNNKHFIDYHDEDYTNSIEATLQDKNDEERDTLQYREDIMYFSKMMFKYINDRHYSDEWQFVFRCYYLMEGRMTYAKLTLMTGINKNSCTKIIQTIKGDIRQNFLQWLKDDERRNNSCDGQATKHINDSNVQSGVPTSHR